MLLLLLLLLALFDTWQVLPEHSGNRAVRCTLTCTSQVCRVLAQLSIVLWAVLAICGTTQPAHTSRSF
jgi:hypothetical protein